MRGGRLRGRRCPTDPGPAGSSRRTRSLPGRSRACSGACSDLSGRRPGTPTTRPRSIRKDEPPRGVAHPHGRAPALPSGRRTRDARWRRPRGPPWPPDGRGRFKPLASVEKTLDQATLDQLGRERVGLSEPDDHMILVDVDPYDGLRERVRGRGKDRTDICGHRGRVALPNPPPGLTLCRDPFLEVTQDGLVRFTVDRVQAPLLEEVDEVPALPAARRERDRTSRMKATTRGRKDRVRDLPAGQGPFPQAAR